MFLKAASTKLLKLTNKTRKTVANTPHYLTMDLGLFSLQHVPLNLYFNCRSSVFPPRLKTALLLIFLVLFVCFCLFFVMFRCVLVYLDLWLVFLFFNKFGGIVSVAYFDPVKHLVLHKWYKKCYKNNVWLIHWFKLVKLLLVLFNTFNFKMYLTL